MAGSRANWKQSITRCNSGRHLEITDAPEVQSHSPTEKGYSKGSVAVALVLGLLVGAVATYAISGTSPSRISTSTSTLIATATTTTTKTATTTLPGVTSTSTTTVTVDPSQVVANAFSTHLQNFQSENLTAILSGYEANATLRGFPGPLGPSPSLPQNYSGVTNIHNVYQVMFSANNFGTVNYANMTYGVTLLANEEAASVHSNFTMYGNSNVYDAWETPGQPPIMGVYSAKVTLSVSYALGNAWLITDETWRVLGVRTCGPATSINCAEAGLNAAYFAHFHAIQSHNTTALAAEYEYNATLEFVGTTPGELGGNYSGEASIVNVLWAKTLSLSPEAGFSSINLTNMSTDVLHPPGDESTNTVNATFIIYGNVAASSVFNHDGAFTSFKGSVRLSISFVRLGNSWLISNEIWDWLYFNER